MAKTTIDIVANDRTARAFNAVRERVAGLTGTMNTLAAGVSAVAGSIGLLSLGAKTIGILQAQDDLIKLARAAGITVESMAGLQLVFEQSGASVEEGTKALQLFSAVIDGAANGSTSASGKLKRLNLDFKELKTLSPEEQFIKLSGALSKLSEADRSVATIDLLGARMGKLASVFTLSEDAMREYIEEGRRLNPVTQESAEAAELFNDSLDTIKRTFSTGLIALTGEYAGQVANLASRLSDAVKQAGLFGGVWKVLKDSITGGRLTELQDEITKSSQQIDSMRKKIVDVNNRSEFFTSKSEKATIVARLESDIDSVRSKMQVLNAELIKIGQAEQDAFNAGNAPKAKFERPTIPEDKGAEKRAKVVKDSISDAQRFINALKEQANAIGKTSEELLVEKAALLGVSDAAGTYIQQITAGKEAEKEAAEAVKAREKALSDIEQVLISVRTPQEKFYARLQELDALLEQGLSFDKYSKALKLANDEMVGLGDKTTEQFDRLQDAVNNWGRRSADAFAEFAVSGKSSIKDLASTVIKEIIAMAAMEKVIRPLTKAFGDLAGSFGGFNFAGAGGGGGSIPIPGFKPSGRARGGPVSAGGIYEVNENNTPELLNAGQKQFLLMPQSQSGSVTPVAMGGGGGGGPSARGGAGGDGNITVNVIESPGKGGQVEQRQGTQGKEIDVYVDEMVARKQASRGSASNKSMRQNFGAQEQLIRR